MKKFAKFIVSLAAIGAACAGAYYVVKNYLLKDANEDIDDFDEFDDDFDFDDFDDEAVDITETVTNDDEDEVDITETVAKEATEAVTDTDEEDTNAE